MGSVLNLMAFVVFATTLFMRAVDPVIPQIAQGLAVEPATAALLSTAFTLPYALIQPILGAFADMLSKTRLMAACMLLLGLSSIASAAAPSFETLMGLRVIGGMAAGGVFPIALAIIADNVPVKGRQVAIGRILFAAMSGNLLGASGAGVVGDLIGWRGVFASTGAIDLIALALAFPGFRRMNETMGRFDLSTFIPNYRAVFSNPLAKFCFGAVFVEAIFYFGVFPYLAVMLRSEGVTSASIAGVVIGRFRHRRRVLYFHGAMAAHPYRRETVDGLGRYGDRGVPCGDRASAAVAVRVRQLHGARIRLLHAARMHSGLRHRACATGARLGHRRAFHLLLSGTGARAGGLWPRHFAGYRHRAGAAHGLGCANRYRLGLRPAFKAQLEHSPVLMNRL